MIRSNILQLLLAVVVRMGVRATTTDDAECDYLEANALRSGSDTATSHHTKHSSSLLDEGGEDVALLL